MIKVFDSESFNLNEPAAKLIEIHSRGVDKGWMKKQAAMFTKEVAELRPEPGHSYIHLISLGAGEAIGPNRNGDHWPHKAAEFVLPEPKKGTPKIIKLAGGLVEYHKTFKKAHVFANHNNDDPKKAIGSIIAETYNEPMMRGELIIKVAHGPLWDKELQKLANDELVSFSIAAKVPYDHCSYCGNQARTRAEYCGHLRDNMTMITKEGHQIFAINDRPDFFDISKVFRPADRTAYSLRKVAGAPLSGVELAESYGLVDEPSNIRIDSVKRALADKFAEMEKQIELCPAEAKDLAMGCPSGGLSDEQAGKLKNEPPAGLLNALAEAKVVLPLRDFLKVFNCDTRFGPEAESVLPGIFGRMSCSDSLADEDAYASSKYAPASGMAKSIINSLIPGLSVDSEPSQKRVRIMIIKSAGVVDFKERYTEASKQATKIAEEYAKYLVSFAKSANIQDNKSALGLTIVRNYLKV